MSSNPEVSSTVLVKILDREYQIACPPSEQDALLKSARYLDENMRKIKSRGTIHGLEKVAVMAALNITHELIQKNQQINLSRHSNAQKIKYLEDKVDRAMLNSRQIEL
jgi:cell division protein ZapA